MRFPYQATLGSVLRDFAGVQRRTSYARTVGLSSITAGEGSLDLLPTDTSTTPVGIFGDLPGGGFGIGALIDGSMVNLASYARAEKVRNDTQDKTLASHNTRITTAQSTANGAVTVNSTQNSRLNSLESSMGGAASQSQVNTLIDEIGSLKLRVIAIENMIRSLHPGVLP
jgi:hypothetical protein